jgi:hypothetical protein
MDETKISEEVLGINKNGFFDKECRKMKNRLDAIRNYLRKIEKFPHKAGVVPLNTREDHSILFKKYKQLIKEKKAKYRQKWFEGIDNSKKLGQYNNKLKATGVPNGDIPLFEHDTGEQMTPEETINKVACDLFPGCIDEKEYKPIGDARRIAAAEKAAVDLNDPRAAFITVESVKKSLKSFGRYKGSGSDELKPVILQKLGENALTYLVAIYRASYLLNYVPQKWLEVKIVFLTKPNKTNLQKSNAFRPISLMQFFWKGFEKLLQYENKKHSGSRHYRQHGFRQKYSTESALTVAAEIIEHSLIKHEFCLATCLDLTNCFGTLPFAPVIAKMRKLGCKDDFIGVLKDFMENRKMNIAYKGVNLTKYCTIGQGQGSCISPWAFSIICDEILEELDEIWDNDLAEGSKFYFNAFADDLILFSTGTDLGQIYRLKQKALKACQSWASKNGLKFEPTKSTTCLHTRKQKYQKEDINEFIASVSLKITLYEKEILKVDSYKYLGVIFDEQLNYSKHLEVKINEAKRTIGKVWSDFSKLKGMSPRFCLYLWTTCIRPKLTYGCFLWAKVTQWESYIKKLNYIQRYALRTMGHFRQKMPGCILEALTGTLPLYLYVQAIAMCTLIRTRGHEVFKSEEMRTLQPKLRGHRSFIIDKMAEYGLSDYNLLEVDLDAMQKQYRFDKKFEVDNAAQGSLFAK